jgi:SAM-dependent methyltransferase
VCGRCLLVQLEAFETPENIFGDYAYFSSFSDAWLAHAAAYVERFAAERRLGPSSLVVELASNDGYLLREFVGRRIPVTGVEPARNVAEAAIANGVPTRVAFFGQAEAERMAAEGSRADLVVANNVLAHVPDLHDFVAGIAILLKPQGLATIEFPHVLRTVEDVQFDQIYHEHFSYFSLLALEPVFARHGLRVHDVDELPTHGGSLRLHVVHANAAAGDGKGLARTRAAERAAGLDRLATYTAFPARVAKRKREFLRVLLDAREEGLDVAAYGAPAKGNTLLVTCGVRADLIRFTVDRSPHKQGRLLPGSRIPISAPDRLRVERPQRIVILPWNLREEIVGQIADAREWGARFVVAMPAVEVF